MSFWKLQFSHLTMIVMDFGMTNWWNLSLKVYTKRPSQTKPGQVHPTQSQNELNPGQSQDEVHKATDPAQDAVKPCPYLGPMKTIIKKPPADFICFYLGLLKHCRKLDVLAYFTLKYDSTPTECWRSLHWSSSSITFYLIQPSIGNKREQRVM